MSSICLVDLDLLYGIKSYPNLELMKVFNYHIKKGDMVKLATKKEIESRFNKIIYFKSSSTLKIPRNIEVVGKNKRIYGEGFYNQFKPLPDIYINSPPDPTVYYNTYEKFKSIKNWNKFSEKSIIRYENHDFTGWKDSQDIYIVDKNFCQKSNTEDFIQEYKNYNLIFFNSLKINSKEEYKRFERYTNILKTPLYINFIIDKDFLMENYKERLTYNLTLKRQNETDYDLYTRIAKIGIILKQNNSKIATLLVFEKDPFKKELLKWIGSYTTDSFYKFTNASIQKQILFVPPEVQFYLKTNPLKLSISMIDF